jgi:hypothetical protein
MCKKNTMHDLKIELGRYPNELIVSMERSILDMKSLLSEKILEPINIGDNIKIHGLEYEPIGSINHIGENM